MKMRQSKKSLSFIFCMMLFVAIALCTSGCNDKIEGIPVTQETEIVTVEEDDQSELPEGTSEKPVILGEGKNHFLFTVVDKEGTETFFEIYTDKEIVGDALLELGLISGEDSQYGLFVKAVNGIVADYDEDATYWAFYVNGEYAMAGVDTTTIEENTSYMFKVEK